MRYAVIKDKAVTNIIEIEPENVDFMLSALDCSDLIASDTLGIGDTYEPAPPPPSDIDILGQQLVEKDLEILQLQADDQTLGQQVVNLDLRLLAGGM